jgi:hydrogenase small subunit
MQEHTPHKLKIIWLQSITCNGNTHSFLNHPDLFGILSHFSLLYHPVLETKYTLEDVVRKRLECDVLILEGAFKKVGVAKYEREIFEVASRYATEASFVITAGTCATFGGIFKQYDPKNISGFVFDGEAMKEEQHEYRSKLISLPGCPIHPKWLGFVLMMIAQNKKIVLDALHRPKELYATTVHTGCGRNEYFEWKVDAKGFGLKEGCLFYEHGCQGPYTHGSCNRILWNDTASKTIVGTPCFGCTEPTFPKENLFLTKTHMGIPATMPLGIPRRAYLTATGVIKSFRIKRFEERLIEYDR